MNFMEKFIPAIKWMKHYRSIDFKQDALAGLIVAILLVPQAMAYAMLAGLPPVVGLYASTIPILIYALFGSSRHLAVGPVAIISLLVFTGVSQIAQPGTSEYLSIVLLLTFMVGVMQFALGIFRLGFMINFISHAVISGFISAAAIVIGLSQLKHILGINLAAHHSSLSAFFDIVSRIGETDLMTLAIGVGSIITLGLFRRWFPKFPASLLIVIIGISLVYFLQLHLKGVSIVGNVPKGFPNISVPVFSLNHMVNLFPVTLTILFIGYMESIAMANLIAAKEKYKIDANQEFKALGLANIASSLFSGYPVTGGFSRTAVNYQAGARTGVASIITASLIILTLLFFTPLFYYLPKAVLAAIIIVAVVGLINVKEAKKLFKIKKVDGWTLILTFIITLTFGVEKGIISGIVLSLLLFIWRSAHPRTVELGFVKAENRFRDIKRFPDAKIFDNTIIMRVDAALYFANMKFVEDKLKMFISNKPETKRVIIDFSSVNDIDGVAIHILEEIVERYGYNGVEFLFAGLKGQIQDIVERAGWKSKYGKRIEYATVQDALNSLYKE